MGHPPNGHRQVQVELDTLIESVIIGPKLNETAMRSVRLLLTRKGLDKPVLTSKLSRLPYH
ncbi:MAG: hypothetical protein DMG72_20650 [Acidobacteria bacterium]|nr:MAG: hypothetical protein DMG72_20650 [Acidobacteriota bacterium]